MIYQNPCLNVEEEWVHPLPVNSRICETSQSSHQFKLLDIAVAPVPVSFETNIVLHLKDVWYKYIHLHDVTNYCTLSFFDLEQMLDNAYRTRKPLIVTIESGCQYVVDFCYNTEQCSRKSMRFV